MLEEQYLAAANTPSDINEHLPYMVALCGIMSARNVIELGTRAGVSTLAWLHGLAMTGGHLWSVDVDPAPPLPWGHWTFIRGNDLDAAVYGQLPDNVDIVFIDTSHHYDQTLAELNLYRWKLRPGGKFVLHDTELCRPIGWTRHQPEFPVRAAVEAFCADEGVTPTFRPNNNGLGIITL